MEVGYRMEQYLTAGKMGRLLDETVNSPEFAYDYDLAVAKLLFELLVIVTNDIYPDFMNRSITIWTNLLSNVTTTSISIIPTGCSDGVLLLSDFPYSSVFEKILLGLFFVAFLSIGGG